jgi:hypothetical protein
MPSAGIAVLRQGTSTNCKKEKEFPQVSHFDPRIIDAILKSISGTPTLVGMGLAAVIIPFVCLGGICSARKCGRNDYFNANNAFTCALMVTVCGVKSAMGGGVAAGAAERAMPCANTMGTMFCWFTSTEA